MGKTDPCAGEDKNATNPCGRSLALFGFFAPIHPAQIAIVVDGIANGHPENRADKRMRITGRNAEIPCAKVPDDGREQHSKYNAHAVGDVLVYKHLYGQQMNDAHSTQTISNSNNPVEMSMHGMNNGRKLACAPHAVMLCDC